MMDHASEEDIHLSRRDAAGKRIGAIVAVASLILPFPPLSLFLSLPVVRHSIGISKSRAAQVDSPDLEHPSPTAVVGWRAFNRIEDSSLLARALKASRGRDA